MKVVAIIRDSKDTIALDNTHKQWHWLTQCLPTSERNLMWVADFFTTCQEREGIKQSVWAEDRCLTSGWPSRNTRWIMKHAFQPTIWDRKNGNCLITFQNDAHPLSLQVAIRVPVLGMTLTLLSTSTQKFIPQNSQRTSDVLLFGRGLRKVERFNKSIVL